MVIGTGSALRDGSAYVRLFSTSKPLGSDAQRPKERGDGSLTARLVSSTVLHLLQSYTELDDNI